MFSILLASVGTLTYSAPMLDPIAYRDMIEVPTEVRWDTESDSSFQRVLNKDKPFSNLYYEPRDLAEITSDFTANNSRAFKLRREAWMQFADMAWHFWNQSNGTKKFSINTAYRSYSEQKYLMQWYCVGKVWQCANPWASEHQAWLALDLWVNNRSIDQVSLEWLRNNAHKWWFHNTYQKGVEVDGQIAEPWHWRYVWVDLATLLHDEGLTLAEWYRKNS